MGVGIAGAISTLLLIVLFIINVFINIKKSPARRRRLLCWITSMPMVVSTLSLMMFLVPRASDICDTVKQMYTTYFNKLGMFRFLKSNFVFTQILTVRLDALCRPGAFDSRWWRRCPKRSCWSSRTAVALSPSLLFLWHLYPQPYLHKVYKILMSLLGTCITNFGFILGLD